MTTQNNLCYAAIDDGSGSIMVKGMIDGKIVEHTIPALIQEEFAITDGGYGAGNFETEEGGEYFVSRNIPEPVSTTSQRYQTSEPNRVLIQQALIEAGFAGRDVAIAVGLPLRQFYSIGSKSPKNEVLIQAKKDNIKKGLKSFGGDIANITEVIVIPEAHAGVISIRDELGLDADLNTVIVDIGEYSLDIAVMTPDNTIIASKTTDEGLHKLKERIQATIIDKTDIPKTTPALIERVIRDKNAAFKGETIDLSDIIAGDVHWYAKRVIRTVTQIVESPGTVNSVFIGGGCILPQSDLKSVYEQYDGTAIFAPNPETVNRDAFYDILVDVHGIQTKPEAETVDG